jgi:hypothetical protein
VAERELTDNIFTLTGGHGQEQRLVLLSIFVVKFDVLPTLQVQKVFNEVYRSFNTNQSPFIVADFIIPTSAYCFLLAPLSLSSLVSYGTQSRVT